MTLAVAICGFLAGSVVGTLVAWAKMSATSSPAALRTATPRSCAASPTFSSSTCSISAAARRSAPSAASSARGLHRRAGLRHRRHRHRHRLRRLSGGGLPRRLPDDQPRRDRGGALGRHASLADVPPHRRAAGSALRHSGPRQRLAAHPEGIGADLGHGPRRVAAPVADRRRLDAPSVRLLHHGRRALPAHHLGFDLLFQRAEPIRMRGVRRAS